MCEDCREAESYGGGIVVRFAADLEQPKAERFGQVVGDGTRIDRCRGDGHRFLLLVNIFLSLTLQR